jgi:hypothetical protein
MKHTFETKREPRPIICWGYGCEERLPDDTKEIMQSLGWGFMLAPDDFASGGMGYYFACPAHKEKMS